MRSIVQTLLCAIGMLTICSRSQAMESNTSQWKIPEFMISHWGIPKEEKDLRDAGTINAELKQRGPILIRLKSVDVFRTPPIPKNTRAAPQDHWVQSPTENLVLGVFPDRERRDFTLVVNREYRFGQEAVLEFTTSASTVEKIDKNTGKWVALPTHPEGKRRVSKLSIQPGDGERLHVTLQ
jgi:hypothetical protein